MNNLPKNISGISGAGGMAGGGGKGGGGPKETRDNQFSNVLARILIAYSSATTGGLIDGAKSIFLDKTALLSDSGEFNFQGVRWGESDGTGYAATGGMQEGFTSSNNVVDVNAELTKAGGPVIRTVSGSDIDQVRIIITIPALQDVTEDGDINGTSVRIRIDVRDPSSGVWEERVVTDISGKSSGPFQRQFIVAKPGLVTDAWDWRVTRETDDSDSSRLSNDTTVQSFVEDIFGEVDYTGTAFFGLEIDTSDFGNSIPNIAFEVEGVRVRVPTNYFVNDGIPSYSGTWDGTFKWSVTSNPVWHLYHLLVDDEVGLGLSSTYIDRFNFYDVARYCDAVDNNGDFVGISDGNGGVRRRYTINTQIRGQQEGIKMMQEIASSMRAVLYFGAGAVVLKQDRPRSTAAIVSNENVKDGVFVYSSTAAKDRITVAKVAYNDPEDFFRQRYAVYPPIGDWDTDTDIARYGRNEIEVVKFGCADQAEAFSFAKWIVYTSVKEDRMVTFMGGPEFMLTRPGDIIEIYDRRLAGAASFEQRMGGRIVGGTTTTVELDSSVELVSGEDYEITIVGEDGKTLIKRDITTGPGTHTSVTVSPGFGETPVKNYTWAITGTDIAPQKFNVINVEQKGDMEVEVFAVKYDENKFAAVEEDIFLPEEPFTRLDVTSVKPPTNLTFQEASRVDPVTGPRVDLIARWTESEDEFTRQYRVRWRKQGEPWQQEVVDITQFVVQDIQETNYDFIIYTENSLGYISPPLTGSYLFGYGAADLEWQGDLLTIEPPTITTPAEFTGKDLKIEWERASENNVPGIVFYRYLVDFYVDGELVRSDTTSNTTYTYYYDDMVTDQGVDFPSRTITFQIREQVPTLQTSTVAERVFNNPSPNAPNVEIWPGFETAVLDMTPPDDPDIAGYMVFRSTNSGFTASESTRVYEGPDPSFIDAGLAENTQLYYRVAAYDLFDKRISQLNIGPEIDTKTISVTGKIIDYKFENINFSVSGQTVFWSSGRVIQIIEDQTTTFNVGSGSATRSSGTLYIYFNPQTTRLESSNNLATIFQGGTGRRIVASFNGSSLTEGTISPIINGADILANTIGATQLVSSNVITNSAQIANGIIRNANIGNSQVTNAKIANAAINNAKLSTASVDNINIRNGAINSAKIQDGSITNAKIGFAAITSAKIQNLAVDNIKIGNNAVSTFKMQDGAVTAGGTVVGSGSINVNMLGGRPVTVWVNLQGTITADEGQRFLNWQCWFNNQLLAFLSGSGTRIQSFGLVSLSGFNNLRIVGSQAGADSILSATCLEYKR